MQVSFVDSILFPYNYSFHDNSSNAKTNILSEVSACRFVNDSHVALIGDSGELFWASVQLHHDNDDTNGTTLNVHLLQQVALDLPGYTSPRIDAEGCEVFFSESSSLLFPPNSILISSETPLALTWFDRTTGQPAPNRSDGVLFPYFHIPADIVNRTDTNKGFEAVTKFTSARLLANVVEEKDDNNTVNPDENVQQPSSTSFLVTTTEGELNNDPMGYHHFWIWDAGQGGDPLLQLGHWASRWKEEEKGSHNEFLAISDMEFWTEQELLLLLERGYDGITNMIRLWAVELTFPVTRNRQLLLEWTKDTLTLTPGTGQQQHPLPVDNYEAICLFPQKDDDDNESGIRHLLMVNDENHNPNQIGTQFVVLRLEASSSPLNSPSSLMPPRTITKTPSDTCAPKNGMCQTIFGPWMVTVIVLASCSLMAAGVVAFRRGKCRKGSIPLCQNDRDDVGRDGSDRSTRSLEMT
jgi:Esterase-like activity of phytase